MSNLLDKEWLETKEASGKVVKTISYQAPDEKGVMETQTVDVEIYVLPGTKYARYQDALIEKNPDGTVDVNTSNGTRELLMMALGISNEQLDLIKRNKSMALYLAIVGAVQEINNPTIKQVEEEKNEEGQD